MAATTGAQAGTVTQGWLHDTLEQLIDQIRTLLDVTGVAFVTVDRDRAAIRPAAAWFASEEASRAFTPLLERPYDPERAGVTEAAVESGRAVLIPRVAEWQGAARLRGRPAGRARAAGAPGRAPRRAARPAGVGLLPHGVVHLVPRAHGRRTDVRRARDLLQSAPARAHGRRPALRRGVRPPRRARARALRAARARGRAAAGGGARQPRPARRRRLHRPRRGLRRDRRAGRRVVRRDAGVAHPLRPVPGRAARRRGHGRLGAHDARALRARRGDDRARRRDGGAVRLDGGGQAALPPLGRRDGGRDVVHARAHHAGRPALRRADRDARAAGPLRRDGPAAPRLARGRRGRRDLPRARV